MSWTKRPTFIDHWPENQNVDCVIFADENGDADLSFVKKQLSLGRSVADEQRFFTLTTCCVYKDNFPALRDALLQLKLRHWDDGLFTYNGVKKRVCLHSRDIRRREGAFHNRIINRTQFLEELTNVLSKTQYGIASYCVDKVKHVQRYQDAVYPYSLCFDFLLERITINYIRPWNNCIIILEARGKDHDRMLLEKIMKSLAHGTRYRTAKQLSNIVGVYFNPKWKLCDEEKSYFGLELADLVSYPIHKRMVHNREDPAYESICEKIFGYPDNLHYGLKRFP